jgi:hypothetical protein
MFGHALRAVAVGRGGKEGIVITLI